MKYSIVSKHLILSVALACGTAGALKGSFLIDYDFDQFTTGSSIVGQDGWINFSGDGGTGPVVREETVSINGTPTTVKGLGHLGTNIVTRAYRSFGNFGLTDQSTITLEFDLVRVGSNAQGLVGVGAADSTAGSAGHPASVGTFSSTGFAIRGEQEGTRVDAVDANGDNILPNQGDLYRIRSVWTLAGTGSGTLEIMNLSQGETEFTQLFFNQAQTQATADLELSSDLSTWEHLWIRPGGNDAQAGLVTNLTMVPEPSTYALIFGLFIAGAVLMRRSGFRR